ncbi:hypothetical protein ACP70R_026408 [Stipagrostis hirtigluma subsp. patula]
MDIFRSAATATTTTPTGAETGIPVLDPPSPPAAWSCRPVPWTCRGKSARRRSLHLQLPTANRGITTPPAGVCVKQQQAAPPLPSRRRTWSALPH